MTTLLTRRAALAGLSAMAAAPALAQSGRTITMMHGFTPGANVDIVARLVAEHLGKRLGQTIVVESRPGAGGTTAAAAVARSTPDGTTIAILPGGHAVSAAIYNKLPYDAVADFTFISMLTDFPFILATYPDHPARSVADVIRSAQAEEGKLTCATAGNGTGMHLALELFMAMGKAQHAARALPRFAAGDHGPPGQARRLSDGHAGRAHAADQGRQAARDRDHRSRSVSSCCRTRRRSETR